MKRACSLLAVFSAGVVALSLTRASTAMAQAATLTGRVLSESGQPLESANLLITELAISVPTNAEGRYTITIPGERVRGQAVTLRARAIGHLSETRSITIRAGAQTFDFQLKRDINRLESVIVTGVTGATEQRKTTFAVTSLNSEQDLVVKPSSALTSIAGKVPGATVVGGNGRPGSAPAVVLRGAHSINATDRDQGPLIIVDGILLNGSSSDINPDDIESIEIVKGAAGASTYGSRAQNGVISIRTKRATEGAPGLRIEARQEAGADDIQGSYPFPTRTTLLLDETQSRYCIKSTNLPTCSRTIDWDTEVLRINSNETAALITSNLLDRDYGLSGVPSRTELKGIFEVTEWPKRYNPIDLIKTNQPHVNSTVNLTGRNAGTGYYVSFTNFIQQGPVKNLNGYNRQNARANVDQTLIGGALNISMQMGYTRSQQYPDDFGWFGLTREHAAANLLQRDTLGRLVMRPDLTLVTGSQLTNNNPLYFAAARDGRANAARYLGSLNTRYNATSWLTFEAQTSVDERRTDAWNVQEVGFRVLSPTDGNANGSMQLDGGQNFSYNISLSGSATHTFGNDLTSRIDLRYNLDEQQASTVRGTGSALTVEGLRDLGNSATRNATNTLSRQKGDARSVAATLGYRDRYFFDGSIRRDGSSLFGYDERYHDYYRSSFAWLASEESWFKVRNYVDQLKFRFAVGTAGARPSFAAQYEALTIGSGGSITGATLGNKDLRPETTLETEWGVDAELFNKYGLNVTYARDITTDELLSVPQSVATGFSNQWQNAGTMDGRTWEVSLNVPIIARQSLVWTSRLNWDQNRSYITRLDVPAYNSGAQRFAVGERYGNTYGRKFVTDCKDLGADFVARCGPGKEWQPNDEGFIVWVGEGNSYKDGITKNLWQSMTGGCIINGVVRGDIQGIKNCEARGGTVNTPYGQRLVHWGMLTTVRDSNGAEMLQLLGNSMPLWKIGWSHNVQYKRLTGYVLIDKVFGNKVYNEDRQWSMGDFMTSDAQQNGKSVEDAKPIGYYWRAAPPENAAGVGGTYSVLGPTTISYEDGSYVKIRELSISYNLGRFRRIIGDWSLTAVGRNLYTWTKYTGWDPDIGGGGGQLGSGALYSVQSSSYPQIRNFTLTLSSKF